MDVKIKETGKMFELSIIDPDSGIDWTDDLIGNTSEDGFELAAEDDRDYPYYNATQATFDWWALLIEQHQAMDNRIYDLEQAGHGDVIAELRQHEPSVDLEDYPAEVMAILDEFEKTIQ